MRIRDRYRGLRLTGSKRSGTWDTSATKIIDKSNDASIDILIMHNRWNRNMNINLSGRYTDVKQRTLRKPSTAGVSVGSASTDLVVDLWSAPNISKEKLKAQKAIISHVKKHENKIMSMIKNALKGK